MNEPLRPIVLHSSWRGRGAAVVAPIVLVGLGSVGLLGGGVHWWPLLWSGLGLVLAVVVVADYPLWCVFTPSGVVRRCLVRSETLEWERIDSVIRPAYAGRLGRLRRGSTGLVAVVGRRRYLLTDRMESRAEHETLLLALGRWARGTPVEASLPPDDHPPTWLYKRKRGRDPSSLVDLI